MPTNAFRPGDRVMYDEPCRIARRPLPCVVTRILPDEQGQHWYRIRGEITGVERAAAESWLSRPGAEADRTSSAA